MGGVAVVGRGGGRGGQQPGLGLELREAVWVLVQVGEQHPLLVVRPAQDLVIVQVELVTHAEPGDSMCKVDILSCVLIIALTGVRTAGRRSTRGGTRWSSPSSPSRRRGSPCYTQSSSPSTRTICPVKHLIDGCIQSYLFPPEVVPLAEQQVALGVEGVAHLAQPRVTAAALEAVLVPVQVQGLPTEKI